jgi:hypothetical protein
MRKGYFWLSLLGCVLLFVTCRRERRGLLLDEKTMINVLADAHLAEAAAQNLYGPTRDSVLRAYYQQIFNIHEVDQDDFERSMEWLRENPKYLERIYAAIIDSLSARESRPQ